MTQGHIWLNNKAKANIIILVIISSLFKFINIFFYLIFKPLQSLITLDQQHLQCLFSKYSIIMQF